jgi:hypothetical protein
MLASFYFDVERSAQGGDNLTVIWFRKRTNNGSDSKVNPSDADRLLKKSSTSGSSCSTGRIAGENFGEKGPESMYSATSR